MDSLRKNFRMLAAMAAVVVLLSLGGMFLNPPHLRAQATGACTANFGAAPVFSLANNGLAVCNNGQWSALSLPSQATISASFSLTNAQVLGMEAAPFLLVAAQGAGTLTEVESAVIENANTGTAYANGGAVSLFYGTTNTAGFEATTTLAATFLTTPTVTQEGIVTGTLASCAATACLNAGLYLSNLTAPFITGTGTVNVQLRYRVHTGL